MRKSNNSKSLRTHKEKNINSSYQHFYEARTIQVDYEVLSKMNNQENEKTTELYVNWTLKDVCVLTEKPTRNTYTWRGVNTLMCILI